MIHHARVGEGKKRYGSPRPLRFLWVGLCSLLVARTVSAQISSGDRPAYRSPLDVAFSPDGSLLAVADRTWPGLVLIRPGDGTVVREVKLKGDPFHVAWNGGGKVVVAEGLNGTVAEVDATTGEVLRRISVGMVAKGVAVAGEGRLLVGDRALNKLVVVSLDKGQIESSIGVGREPGTVAVSKDGKLAVVGNRLPRPSNPLTGAPASDISLVNLATGEARTVLLAAGTTMVRQVVLSPDGKWAYVSHQSPRGQLPVTQLDNGWVMTNALSIIDVAAGTLYGNFIFDRRGQGAGGPWGVAINGDGSKLWVTLAGVREVATVDLTALHKRLAGYTQAQRANLLTNLSDLHDDGTIKRTPLSTVEGIRGIALSPDGKTLAVAAYFSGKVLLLSASDLSVAKMVALPNNPAEDQIRSGERFYYSALDCYQKWLSCSSCHDEGRADGLNWDLSNDGTGNPKQTKSHVYSSETPPTNVSGCRENALVSSRAGYQFIQFQAAPEDRVQATYAFMKSIQPEPSPHLGPDGQLTSEAVEGKKLFDGVAGCSECHKGTYFTDMLKHDVGTRRFGTEGPDNNPTWDTAGYDTPTLIEVWRSAPYLHLGTSMTIKDVLTTENKNKSAHGKVAGLTDTQIDQIVAYVLQIGPTRQVAVAPAGTGGNIATGGTGAGGTTTSTGGSIVGAGGMVATGGASSGAGGATATGGDSSVGGNSSTGGSSSVSGGMATTGGASTGTGGGVASPASGSCICSLKARPTGGGRWTLLMACVLFGMAVRRRPGKPRQP